MAGWTEFGSPVLSPYGCGFQTWGGSCRSSSFCLSSECVSALPTRARFAPSTRQQRAAVSVLGEVLKSVRVHRGIGDGGFNPLVTEKRLNRACVLPLRSE